MSSDGGWLIWGTSKVQEVSGPCLWEKLEGEGRGSEDSVGSQQGAGSHASVASGNREPQGQVFP